MLICDCPNEELASRNWEAFFMHKTFTYSYLVVNNVIIPVYMKGDIKKEINKLAKKMSVNKKPTPTPKIPPAKRNRRTGKKDPSVTKVTRNGNVIANQYQLDPRQKLAWDYYIDPRSDTFSNALRSAIKAGYAKSYANHITSEQWWCERMRRLGLFTQAETVLEEMLNLPTNVLQIPRSRSYSSKDDDDEDDEEDRSYVSTDPALVRIKQDTAKFIAETLGKNEGYSKKTELVASGKIDLVTGNKALDDLFADDDE